MARDKDQGSDFNPLGWMVTFGDLITLLLTFFVMLLAMREPEIQKLKAVFGIFAHGGPAPLALSDKAKIQDLQRLLDSIRQPTAEELTSPEQQLARKLQLPPSQEGALPAALQPGVNLRSERRGMVITLANDLLFAPGRAELSPRARQAIRQAAQILRYGDQPVSVEGHTDNVPPPPNGPYPDNWSLSLARAEAVLHQLIEEGIAPSRLRVAALGDTRPLVPNDTPQHRAMNRRTEIVILVPNP